MTGRDISPALFLFNFEQFQGVEQMKNPAHAPGLVVGALFVRRVSAIEGHTIETGSGRPPARLKVEVRPAGETGQPGFGELLAAGDRVSQGERLQVLEMRVKQVKRIAGRNILAGDQCGWNTFEGRLDEQHIPIRRPVVDDGGDFPLQRGEDGRADISDWSW